MQVQPNSTIYLLAGVPIDKGYNYSLYFYTKASQITYMQSMRLSNGTFTGQQYTRVEKGRLRVQVCADDVITCNYIMFKNDGTITGGTRYADKWFYAFAHVQYVNEQCCDVIFEIDDIQTWMFDYEFNECFVEREHSATDVAGDNLQPEPVDTGTLVAMHETDFSVGDYMFGAIITNKPLHYISPNASLNGEVFISVSMGGSGEYRLLPEYAPYGINGGSVSQYDSSTGIANGLYIYTGLLLNESDWTDYFSAHISEYNINNPQPIVGTTHSYDKPLTFGLLCNAIINNDIYYTGSSSGGDFSEDNIVACYQYPCNFNLISALQEGTAANFKAGVGMVTKNINKPQNFSFKGVTYTPRNNKLLTAPYVKLFVSSLTGSSAEYNFEFFGDRSGTQLNYVQFAGLTSNFSKPSATCTPLWYKGKQFDYDEGLNATPYPVPIYSGDAFTRFWQQNKNAVQMSALASVLTSFAGMAMGNPIAAASGVMGVLGTEARISDIKNTPPNSYYQTENDVINVGTNRYYFAFYTIGLTPEYARKIDSFFTKYGYAVNELKVPNLQRSSTKRLNWNYLKVKNCMLHGTLPADVEDHLERIYEKGITFWNYNVTVGDYSIANPIVTPSTP